MHVIQYNVRIFICVGLRRQQIQYVMLTIRCFVVVFLRSGDFEIYLFRVKKIGLRYSMSSDVESSLYYKCTEGGRLANVPDLIGTLTKGRPPHQVH